MGMFMRSLSLASRYSFMETSYSVRLLSVPDFASLSLRTKTTEIILDENGKPPLRKTAINPAFKRKESSVLVEKEEKPNIVSEPENIKPKEKEEIKKINTDKNQKLKHVKEEKNSPLKRKKSASS